ncbi:HepT-like ribonuclease domain-containing protein [Subtercola frigoramans]|uniref:Uncharacterized protein with HEPN domain n=1 Tax=Subtercola frigoramans TaxID=120298 RepID=A0ABS2L9L7_9MICO|nr:HepT-like ribonuclease domain-containing protein [Subtercola frigoramans]MBM7473571.1 uncharacterized protein with HEPN domain [Subtercola frigoramans]
MSRSDAELISDALDHIEALKRHVARSDIEDDIVADAVSLRLAAAIESISQTSATFREETFGDDWKVIWATRNRIAHGYAFIDIRLILDTVANDVPEFERKLRG